MADDNVEETSTKRVGEAGEEVIKVKVEVNGGQQTDDKYKMAVPE